MVGRTGLEAANFCSDIPAVVMVPSILFRFHEKGEAILESSRSANDQGQYSETCWIIQTGRRLVLQLIFLFVGKGYDKD
jgi:hypothetical protein